MKTNTTRSNLRLEALEDRQLLTTGITLTNGVVKIEGSDKRDVAKIAYFEGVLTVGINVDGRSYAVRQFFGATARSIKSVEFRGYGADDKFTNDTSLPSKAFGGSGNDTFYGGSGIDKFYGDAGNDTLRGYGGKDLLRGDGDNDYLYGGDQNDELAGGSGSDHLYGGEGHDWLDGGAGVDHLFGEGGNDFLFGYAYLLHRSDNIVSGWGGAKEWQTDYLSGGSGADRFEKDQKWSRNPIEYNVFKDFNAREGDTKVDSIYWR